MTLWNFQNRRSRKSEKDEQETPTRLADDTPFRETLGGLRIGSIGLGDHSHPLHVGVEQAANHEGVSVRPPQSEERTSRSILQTRLSI